MAWVGLELTQLFDQIKTRMPQGSPGSLSSEQTVDLMAYLFQTDGAPAGSADLPADAEKLKALMFRTRPAAD
jgi:hypothetical protein